MLMLVISVQAQTELAKIEYTRIPQQQNNNTYSRVKIAATLPIAMRKKGHYILPNIHYRLNNIQLEDEIPFEAKEHLENFHTIGVALGYTFPFGKDWRFVTDIGVRISSNLEVSTINHQDYQYTGSLYFIRKRKEISKPSTLVLGLRYTTPGNVSYPIPILNYYQQFHPQWSYAIGTPISNIKYYSTNQKHTFQIFAAVERFYANIQTQRTFLAEDNTVQQADNISMFTVFGALGYEYYLTKQLVIYLNAGHTLSNQIRLRNSDSNDVYIINDKNALYLRSGIKFKI